MTEPVARLLRRQLCLDSECKFDRGCGCLEAIDKTLRKVIDQTWGEALEDGSVPSAKLQDKILASLAAHAST